MTNYNYPKSAAEAKAMDDADPLARFREMFILPEGVTYLVGHSLGPASRAAVQSAAHTAEDEWARGLVGSWNAAGWIDLATTVGGQVARLIGVEAADVVLCDSVSLNLYKLAGALLKTPNMANRVLVNAHEFPTDQYMMENLARQTGAGFQRVAEGEDIAALENGGVLVKSLVDYRTAEIADMQRYETVAALSGGAVIWDLSHATGVLNLALAARGVKYAVGCTYKYLNGGPGAPAFVYVHSDYIDQLETPLPGWLGHKAPFDFSPDYESASGVRRFVSGTPGILSLSALHGALAVFDKVRMADVEHKARCLGALCLARFQALGLASPSPQNAALRGGHVSVQHPNGYEVSRAMAERGHQTDFRTPDTIRFGLSPLFLRYQDVWQALDDLADILDTESWKAPRFAVRQWVT